MNKRVLIIIALEEEFRSAESLIETTLDHRRLDLYPWIKTTRTTRMAGDLDLNFVVINGQGPELATSAAERASNEIKPDLIVNFGIAGQVDEEQSLGDVVVAESVDNYTYRMKVKQSVPTGKLSFPDMQWGGQVQSSTPGFASFAGNLRLIDPLKFAALLSAHKEEINHLLTIDQFRELEDEKLINGEWAVRTGPIASGPFLSASRQFVKWLQSRNRLFLAVEMEAYGVLLASRKASLSVPLLIVKGLSDPSDERKKDMDRMSGGAFRKLAARNAMRVLLLLLDNLEIASNGSLANSRISSRETMTDEESIQTWEKLFLPSSYSSLDKVSHQTWDAYSGFFSLASQEKDFNLPEIAAKIMTSNNPNPFVVVGEPGTGKSFFLQILYWFLKSQCSAQGVLPVYIDLGGFDRNAVESNDPASGYLQTTFDRFRIDLEAMIKRNPDREFIFICDGFDHPSPHNRDAATKLFSTLRMTSHKKIIGFRDPKTPQLPSGIKYGASRILFKAAGVTEDIYSKYIQSLCTIIVPDKGEEIARRVQKTIGGSRIKRVDVFLVSLLCKRASTLPTEDLRVSDVIEDHCRRFILARGFTDVVRILTQCGQYAFELVVKQDTNVTVGDNAICAQVFQIHPRVADYLVARHVIEQIKEVAREGAHKAKNLHYVYVHSVNELAKELLNKDLGTQREILRAIRRIVKAHKARSEIKSHFCYLAGRLRSAQIQKLALDVLKQFKAKIVSDNRPGLSKADLHLIRTIYISLGYLGDKDSLREYIRRLLRDADCDGLNRGFHLEYYGDIPFEPTEPLLSNDDLRPCPLTIEELKKRLLAKRDNPIFEVEVQTLASIGQNRHAKGVLDESDRQCILEILGELLERHRIEDPELRAYVRMVHKHLSDEYFQSSDLIRRLMNLKDTKRAGWLDRGLTGGESVADHTYGAMSIARIYLPKKLKGYDSYDRNKIVEMLLIHDWAEAWMGDIPSHMRTDEIGQREKELYEEISLLGTYADIEDCEEIGVLWREFETRSSINGAIAHDIDHLDNYLQLEIYEARGFKIADQDEWYSQIRNGLTTDVGRTILARICRSKRE